MNGWQIALLVVVVIFAALTGVCATANPFDPSSDMPIWGELFRYFGSSTVILAMVFGLTFLLTR